MKSLFKFGIFLSLLSVSACYGQSILIGSFKQISDALTTSSQDTTKPTTSTQSNLAVSDEGVTNSKNNSKKETSNTQDSAKTNTTNTTGTDPK